MFDLRISFAENTTHNVWIREGGCEMGRGSSVGIATRYGLDGPGIESRWGGGEIFRIGPDRPWGPPSFLYEGYRVFTEGKAVGAWC